MMINYFLDLVGKMMVSLVFYSVRLLLWYLSVALSTITGAPGLVICML